MLSGSDIMSEKVYNYIAILLIMIGIGMDEVYGNPYYWFTIPFFAMSFELIRKKDEFKICNGELLKCFIIIPGLLFIIVSVVKYI